MGRVLALVGMATALVLPVDASGSELVGPGRFCGYSPIIDLLPGEKVTTLDGGIHSGSFRWEGSFGVLKVRGIGWASQPEGAMVRQPEAGRPARFQQRRVQGNYEVSIWNGSHGAAYFRSARPFSRAQIEAIDRVKLFNEGENPEGCNLRTIFSWE